MSFAAEVKTELCNRYFTTHKRHSKINKSGPNDTFKQHEMVIEAFLNCGTITDPEKSYHLEFVCSDEAEANCLKEAVTQLGIIPGVMIRKEKYVVYVKDSESISDMLVIMGATNSVLKFEDIRVMKEMKGIVQRRVNWETANIKKTGSAAAKQLDDISFIRKKHKFSDMPEGLKEVAELRRRYPEASMSELAEMLPGTGKSGINHRFRKIAKIAEQLRAEDEL